MWWLRENPDRLKMTLKPGTIVRVAENAALNLGIRDRRPDSSQPSE